MSLRKYAPPKEQAIAEKLIDAILAGGWTINVNDGVETTLRYSQDREAIFNAMATTEEDFISFHNALNRRIGWFRLIWGNGMDLISDCSANPETDKIVAKVDTEGEGD